MSRTIVIELHVDKSSQPNYACGDIVRLFADMDTTYKIVSCGVYCGRGYFPLADDVLHIYLKDDPFFYELDNGNIVEEDLIIEKLSPDSELFRLQQEAARIQRQMQDIKEQYKTRLTEVIDATRDSD